MKHSIYDLQQMQSLSLDSKLIMTRQRIQQWYDYYGGNVYAAISGGKDSQVLAHIIKEHFPDIPCVYVKTGLEFSSVDDTAVKIADHVLHPAMDFLSVIKKYGYPVYSKNVAHQVGIYQNKPEGNVAKRYFSGEIKGSRFDCTRYLWLTEAPFKISDRCCYVMKKNPSHRFAKNTNRKAIVGTMAAESQTRYSNWLRYGCNAFDTTNPVSAPLSFWTEQDILSYIKTNDIKIASVYGDIIYNDSNLETTGESRTGCVFCLFGIFKDNERLLRLKEIEPLKYDYIMRGGHFNEEGRWEPHNGLGYKFVIDWLNEHGNMNIKY